MKLAQWVASFQIFGLIAHLFLIAALVAIGFFDFLGMEPLAKSSAQLLKTLAAAQSSVGAVDSLSSRIAAETANATSVLLSVMKALSVSAMISFLAHLITFRAQRGDKNKKQT